MCRLGARLSLMRMALGWLNFRAWRVQTKLVVVACIPLSLLIPAVALLLYSAGEAAYSKVLISKLRSDLVLAQQVFDGAKDSKLAELRSWAESAALRNVLEQGSRVIHPDLLQFRAESSGLSYLRMITLQGDVVSSFPQVAPHRISSAQLEMFAQSDPSASVILLGPEDLALRSAELRDRARTPIIPTSKASPDNRVVEERGLVIQIINPIYLRGELMGWLEGGILLNANLSLVDGLNELIYPAQSLLEGSVGTATIFLDDVRVATTVKVSEEVRALGTRVSDEVRETVLGRGRIWLERAFVVNDWYMAGYAPLTNPNGARIGMLYVGYLEKPYAALKTQLLVLFLLAIALSMALGGFLVIRLTRRIFSPLQKMNSVMTRQELGETSARVGLVGQSDEFTELAAHFDELLNQLESRQTQLEALNRGLDERVAERTADLRRANEKLRRAVEQLLASEKLAVMGQLTAGIAHEFNNPLAVMTGHVDLLRLELGESDTMESLRLLDQQVQRMKGIVQKLLQFCRPDEFASFCESFDPQNVIQDSLLFVKAELDKAGVELQFDYRSVRQVSMSRIELQQVMVNLLINAAHALEQMPSGLARVVRIAVDDFDFEDGAEGVRVLVGNNGPVIPAERLPKIFSMFYTTKLDGKGSGIGLPVSRMYLQRYGGDLAVRSPGWPPRKPETGVQFVVMIRCSPRPSADILRESEEKRKNYEQQFLEGI